MVAAGKGTTPAASKLAAALAYWSESPLSETAALPRLKSSTKSALYGAPLLPPPP